MGSRFSSDFQPAFVLPVNGRRAAGASRSAARDDGRRLGGEGFIGLAEIEIPSFHLRCPQRQAHRL